MIAAILLVPTHFGGRTTPVSSGYRATVKFPDDPPGTGHDAIVTVKSPIEPGTAGVVTLEALVPEEWPEVEIFDLMEGDRIIGAGMLSQ